MSFGFSVSDIMLLVQLAHRTFRNCQKAGQEYLEIASEVRCLHSVLRTVRAETQRPESRLFEQYPVSTAQLVAAVDGCKDVLDYVDHMLSKYAGVKTDSGVNKSKKIWQLFEFGSKAEEFGVIREKLITYTSTISVLIDTMQIQATARIEHKIDGGFAQMTGQFERIRKEIYSMASRARAEERNGSTFSLLSLSTYSGDEKEVWQAFHRELVQKGFNSRSLDKYKDVLQAYMLKLVESDLLNRPPGGPGPDSVLNEEQPWWTKQAFLQTFESLNEELSHEQNSHTLHQPSHSKCSTADARSAMRSEILESSPQKTLCNDGEIMHEDSQLSQHELEGGSRSESWRKPQRRVEFALGSNVASTKNEQPRLLVLKSILRLPTVAFPEASNFVADGVGRRWEAMPGGIPPEDRYTKLDRRLISVETVTWFTKRFKVYPDHILVFQILDQAIVRVLPEINRLCQESPERVLRYSFQCMEELLWKINIRFEWYKFYQESVVGLPLPPNAEIFGGLTREKAMSNAFKEYWDKFVDETFEEWRRDGTLDKIDVKSMPADFKLLKKFRRWRPRGVVGIPFGIQQRATPSDPSRRSLGHAIESIRIRLREWQIDRDLRVFMGLHADKNKILTQ